MVLPGWSKNSKGRIKSAKLPRGKDTQKFIQFIDDKCLLVCT